MAPGIQRPIRFHDNVETREPFLALLAKRTRLRLLPNEISRIETLNRLPIQRVGHARTRKPFLPLLGERAGVRADCLKTNIALGFMGGPLTFLGMHRDHEPDQRNHPKIRDGQRREGNIIFVLPNLWAVHGESPCPPDLLTACEPVSRTRMRRRMRRSPVPKVHRKPRPQKLEAHWDHEPGDRIAEHPLGLMAGVLKRAAGAPVSDPARCTWIFTNWPGRRPALRFMESPLLQKWSCIGTMNLKRGRG